MPKGKKVFIAISGGVDSAVASAKLIEAGYDCTGVHMITCDAGQGACADAKQVADDLNMPIHVLDLREDFKTIIEYFCGEYKKARTPNPCVFCNRHIKFGKILDFAIEKGADYIATGHYARIIDDNGDVGIYVANSPKDQSYVLSMINRDAVDKILLPLGEYDKSQIRQNAEKLGLHVTNKPDSQEICFIPDDDYVGLLEKLCPEIVTPGDVVSPNGEKLGQHQGIHKFTIGQRRGLGIAMGLPYYVTALDSESNTVILGQKDELMYRQMLVKSVNWLIDEPEKEIPAIIKIRYNHKGASGKIQINTDGVKVLFDEPIMAITPGQTAVFYVETPLGKRLIGGGWIEGVLQEK